MRLRSIRSPNVLTLGCDVASLPLERLGKMVFGLNGKVLRVNLSNRNMSVETPEEDFYRRYFGGRAMVAYYLLRELEPRIDPLGPENKLVFVSGIVTGAPVPGSGRNTIGAKSPLTEAFGDADVGGFWGAEFKRTGYDAVIVEGKAKRPVYLWIHDDEAEIRDASHLWGKATAESQALICRELDDRWIRVAQIGPAGERLVRYACIVCDLHHFAGRSGMGAVMGSKNLKAIAVRGHKKLNIADPKRLGAIAKWLSSNYFELVGELADLGTAQVLSGLNALGGLPTRNFLGGTFEGAEKISGEAMKESILIDRRGCYACPIRCKRVVRVEGPYAMDPRYGGPEYETIAALGSNCGIADLKAIAKGNELCAAYGLDSISTGNAIAFAMECFEKGLLTDKETGGVELRFGNGGAMVRMVKMIGERSGIGDLLAEGVRKAAEVIGGCASECAMHVKGQEIPMHEPRLKHGLAVGYAVSPTGADHCLNMHDTLFAKQGRPLERIKALGILKPLPPDDLSPAKIRLLIYGTDERTLFSCLGLCYFLPYEYSQLVDIVQSVTGWNSTTWELLKVTERGVNMARVFNIREGLTVQDDELPRRFFAPLTSGTEGIAKAIRRESFAKAKVTYYKMMGWDAKTGTPMPEKLQELGIGWVVAELRPFSNDVV